MKNKAEHSGVPVPGGNTACLPPKAIALSPSLRHRFIKKYPMATAKKSEIEKWLTSRARDYNKGVELYAKHPTAVRGLVNTLQRKRNKFTEAKLAYALEKAAAADKAGRTAELKKKEKTSAGKTVVKEKKRAKNQKPKLSAAKSRTSRPGTKNQNPRKASSPNAKTSTSKGPGSATPSPASPTVTPPDASQ
ncbi:MAG: hypothetical protein AAFZ15_06825 [Bacteroidota bacterium]